MNSQRGNTASRNLGSYKPMSERQRVDATPYHFDTYSLVGEEAAWCAHLVSRGLIESDELGCSVAKPLMAQCSSLKFRL